MGYKYIFVQDGLPIDSDTMKKFYNHLSNRDIRKSKKGNHINFVGFVFKDNLGLVSFPKNYFSKEELTKINNEDENKQFYLKTLYSLINKILIMSKTNNNLKDIKEEINKSYPFDSFVDIYNYYLNYGVYKQVIDSKKMGYRGKVLWKETINKSPKVINNGNLIFVPPVTKKSFNNFDFLSKCMVFAINKTIRDFNYIFNFPLINLEYRDVNFSNTQMIINNLIEIKRQLFKDVNIKLVNKLIQYFSNLQNNSYKKEIKVYSFNLIWEEIVRSLLNKEISKIEEKDHIISDMVTNKGYSFIKEGFYLDQRSEIVGVKTFKIEPDFYYRNEEIMFIYDAKYYVEMKKLDYKQISYYFLLKNRFSENQLNIKNGLILPTSFESFKNVHFSFKESSEEFKIIEYHINMRRLLSFYLKLKPHIHHKIDIKKSH